MKKFRRKIWFAVCLNLALASLLLGQGRHERHEAEVEESGKPMAVSGGVAFEQNTSIDKTYDAVLTFLKKQGYTLESANKDAGQIITVMQVTGHYRQTGTRVQVVLIKETDVQTTVRVTVAEQKRYKGLQTEPWGDPKVNEKASADLSDLVKAALSGSTDR